MDAGRLNGPELLELRDALRRAFTRSRFVELLLRLDHHLDDYAAPADDYPTAVRQVLLEANAALWWTDLLRVARYAVPADPELQALAQRYELGPVVLAQSGGAGAGQLAPAAGAPAEGGPIGGGARGGTVTEGRELELAVKAAQASVDIGVWRARLGQIEGRVCRIEYPAGTERGTGFLIGPDRVLTNHHVVDAVIFGLHRPGKVVLRFDYLVGADGVTVHAGTTYQLAEQWLIDSSPPSPQDTMAVPTAEPAPDLLDYAVLRLATPAGDEPVGGPTTDPNAVPRGWIDLPDGVYPFAPQTALYIVQHPEGRPMQVALDSEGVLGANANRTRVRYTTTTQPGSSGSPCFDADWGLVALHHAGDPKYATLGRAEFNEGIPISTIRDLLAERGLSAVFGPDAI